VVALEPKIYGAVMTDDLREPGRPAENEGRIPDPAALWSEFAPPLRGFLARRVPPGADADDLVQEVFLRVIRHAGTLRSTDRPEAWLFQIARNALRDALRARLRRDGRHDAIASDDDLAAAPDETSERAAEAELAPCLTAMIERLPEPYRTAIALTTLKGTSQADAARQLGISNSGMKSRVQRGRDRLRNMLVQCCSIAVDVRGGVSDFHPRSGTVCGPSAAAVTAGSCAQGSCGSDATAPAASDPGHRRLQQ
jgi:RNA polymerase sigma-70 factor, ECF subfamily